MNIIETIDIAFAVLSLVSVGACTIFYVWLYEKKVFNGFEIFQLLKVSLTVSLFAKNWISVTNWVLSGAVYGFFAYYNQFWFINVSLALSVYVAIVMIALWIFIETPVEEAV